MKRGKRGKVEDATTPGGEDDWEYKEEWEELVSDIVSFRDSILPDAEANLRAAEERLKDGKGKEHNVEVARCRLERAREVVAMADRWCIGDRADFERQVECIQEYIEYGEWFDIPIGFINETADKLEAARRRFDEEEGFSDFKSVLLDRGSSAASSLFKLMRSSYMLERGFYSGNRERLNYPWERFDSAFWGFRDALQRRFPDYGAELERVFRLANDFIGDCEINNWHGYDLSNWVLLVPAAERRAEEKAEDVIDKMRGVFDKLAFTSTVADGKGDAGNERGGNETSGKKRRCKAVSRYAGRTVQGDGEYLGKHLNVSADSKSIELGKVEYTFPPRAVPLVDALVKAVENGKGEGWIDPKPFTRGQKWQNLVKDNTIEQAIEGQGNGNKPTGIIRLNPVKFK